MSIASELTSLAANKAAIKAAIEAKNPSVMPTDVLSQWPTSIASIPSGGGALNVDISEGATFFDYDGTILYHWTAAETASKTALPPLPSHAGLTCQEWNWDLSDIKTDVAAGAFVHVGATYTTDDGKTRLYITIPDNDIAKVVKVSFSQTVANGVTVNWGDGSEEETVAGTGNKAPSHTYSAESYPASFVITLDVTDGTMDLARGSSSNVMSVPFTEPGINAYDVAVKSDILKAAEIGDNVPCLGQDCFMWCKGMKTVTIPKTVTTVSGEGRLFRKSVCPSAVVFPKGMEVTKKAFDSSFVGIVSYPKDAIVGSSASFNGATCPSVMSMPGVPTLPESMFNAAKGLRIVSLGEGMTAIAKQAFYDCSSLVSIHLPSTLTTIGNQAFRLCSSLREIAIPWSVTSISSAAFSGCALLEHVDIPSSASVNSASLFYECYSLVTAALPDGHTTIGSYAFYGCRSLKSVSIPSTVTTIETYAFSGCYSLTTITFPSGLSSISSYAFESSKDWSGNGIKIFDFRLASAVPSLTNTNAFYSTRSDKEIIVPDELYEDWIAADNWNSSTNGIVDSIVKASESSLGPLT